MCPLFEVVLAWAEVWADLDCGRSKSSATDCGLGTFEDEW